MTKHDDWIEPIWPTVLDVLSRHGVTIASNTPLGEGVNGAVFQAQHMAGWQLVVKLTLGLKEVEAIKIVERDRRLMMPVSLLGFPMYPFAPINVGRDDVFVIVREPVAPYSFEQQNELWQSRGHIFDGLHESAISFRDTRGRGHTKYFREYIQSADALEVYYPLIGSALKHIANAHRILIGDVAPDNMGTTHDKRVVLFDYHVVNKSY